jgi:23S rRNA C2498 (ribose-2'-O)-methylase RlmM
MVLIVSIFYFIALCVGIAINCFLVYKCYQKRKSSRVIKEQMAFKKMEFASSMGMNVYQLNNDQRIGATIHV